MTAFLIVDGDRNFRDALGIELRLDGHYATTVGTVEEAQARLAAVRFDCCVVDAHLPDADALLEAAAESGLRAVAVGRYPELLAAAAVRHPHAATLPKPFRACELAARVDRGVTAA